MLVHDFFADALKAISVGARILLVTGQNTLDYALFAPWASHGNRVTPWGEPRFDRTKTRYVIESNRITHVLVENDQQLSFHWDQPILTPDMVTWLADQADLWEVPLQTKGMRLFQVTGQIPVRGSQPLGSSSRTEALGQLSGGIDP
jgi:hypothetical protein